ncbi:fimbrial biogenesis chaperone [Providencia rettgeri]|uniref:fimbrial biogenesis chaperone n=1 Tax=Providencia rettgeri TaxID=587 RepID=UPI0023AA7FE2|nr:fimbria/pilus periplasmic chaperone [Providencia rettgeri]
MHKQTLYFIQFLFCLLFSSLSFFTLAADNGIKFSLQRLTYVSGEKSLSVSLRNTDSSPYLVQANMKWLDEKTGLSIVEKKEKIPFLVTPPLYKISPDEYYSWRLFFSGHKDQLPNDRESVFLIQLKIIPSTEPSQEPLQFTVMRALLFKVYYRPNILKDIKLVDVAKQLSFRQEGERLIVKNNTAIYATFNSLSVGNYHLKDEQLYVSVAPFSEQEYILPKGVMGSVAWDILDENIFPTEKNTIELNNNKVLKQPLKE